MKIRQIFIVILFFSILLPNASYSNSDIRKIPTAGVANEIFKSADNSLKVAITIITSTSKKIPQDTIGGQTIDSQGENLLQTLEIVANGQSIYVPRSSFSDLHNPRTFSVHLGKKESILIINGGDGGDSYFVKIIFDQAKIAKRLLYSSLAPDRPLEQTQYFRTILKDQ